MGLTLFTHLYCGPAMLCFLGLGFVVNPSSRLTNILSQHNLPKPVYILESFDSEGKIGIKKDIKKILNNVAGVYICINLVNGNMYVGSASFKRMYARFRSHLYLAASGSIIVNKAVLKYGLDNFAFVAIETLPDHLQSDKKAILALEQKYLDQLNPAYNILKIAGSVLNLKWSLAARERYSVAVLNNKERIDKVRALHLGKIVSRETRDLMSNSALNHKVSALTHLWKNVYE